MKDEAVILHQGCWWKGWGVKDEAVILHRGCWWKGWGVKDEAVILHRGSFRRECGKGLGCHPSQCWWKEGRWSSFTGVLLEGMGGEG